MTMPATTPSGGPGSAGAPIDCELTCPKCGYSLRLLPAPRCPECGLSFDWDELAAAERARRLGPTFDRRRPVTSVLGTMVLALWPPALWRRVSGAAPARSRSFLFLALLCAIAYAAADGLFLAAHLLVHTVLRTLSGAPPSGDMIFGAGSADRMLLLLAIAAIPSILVFGPAMRLAVAGALWLAMQAFHRAWRRANVSAAELARLVVLSWLGLVGWRWALHVATSFVLLDLGLFGGAGALAAGAPWFVLVLDWSAPSVLVWSLWLGIRRLVPAKRARLLTIGVALLYFVVPPIVLVLLSAFLLGQFDAGTARFAGVFWPEAVSVLQALKLIK